MLLCFNGDLPSSYSRRGYLNVLLEDAIPKNQNSTTNKSS